MKISPEEVSAIRKVTMSGLAIYEGFGEEVSVITHILGDEPALFFETACFGVEHTAPLWMRKISQIAGRLRHIRFGFRVRRGKTGAVIECSAGHSTGGPPAIEIKCTDVEPDEAQELCERLHRGVCLPMNPDEVKLLKMQGTLVSRFTVEFAMGDIPGHNLQCR